MDANRFFDTFFNLSVINHYAADIAYAMIVTGLLAICVIFTGVLLGLFLAVVRSYNSPAGHMLITFFSDLFRALPPLVIILILYFGFPRIGVMLSSFTVCWITLSLVLAAFAEEIFWGGILSIRKGQWEAATATGLSFNQTLAKVIFPQVIRIAIPSLTNRTIAITKQTSLGMVIGLNEVLHASSTATAFSGNATPLTLGALAYILLLTPLIILSRWSETLFRWRRR